MRDKTMRTHVSAALALIAAFHTGASAQLPQASATALALGYNMTASARGFAAVANNPAGLAHPGSPGFSLAFLPIAAETGLGPVTLSDFVDFEGQLMPASAKNDWLDRVIAAGGQAGSVGAGVTPLALSVGPVGFQLSMLGGGTVNLPPDAAELLLFGNAGRTGTPRDFTLDDSAVDGYALSTAAVSFGLQVSPGLYMGVTGKYTIGNGLILGRDAGSLLSASPLSVELEFPILGPRSDEPGFNHGTGVGFDVGAIWERPGLTLGATIQNVVNTFEWKIDNMSFISGEALFDRDTTTSDFDEQPASAAPASFLELVADQTIEPVFSVGAEWHATPLLKLQGDIRKRAAGGLQMGPEFHAGVGAELGLLPFLPLRAHAAVVTDGFQVGGGASLVLGPVNLSGAVALRTGEVQDATLGMFSLSFGAN
jgi:hypothetical protein